MATFTAHKLTALPTPVVPNSIYFIAPAGAPAGYMEIYVVHSDGSTVRSTLTRDQVQAMIDAAVASASGGGTIIVNDIAARNALTPDNAQRVFVVNATGDATVTAGGAEYMWRANPAGWIKISETESQDLVLSWATLTGKPSSTPANIDDAVSKRHAHANMTELNQIGQDAQGQFTYAGARPRTVWEETAW